MTTTPTARRLTDDERERLVAPVSALLDIITEIKRRDPEAFARLKAEQEAKAATTTEAA